MPACPTQTPTPAPLKATYPNAPLKATPTCPTQSHAWLPHSDTPTCFTQTHALCLTQSLPHSNVVNNQETTERPHFF